MTAGMKLMGRPKKDAARPKPGSEGDGRETVIHMKGSPEYVAWLDALHRTTHIPKVQLFRIALADWAASHGHSPPPEI